MRHTAPWTFKEELGARNILDNGSALATGPAGTGQSDLFHQRNALELEAAVCADARVATRLMGGNAVAHILMTLNTWGQWIFVDEVSLFPLDALGNLARLKLRGATFILFGDYNGQVETARTDGQ